MAKTILQIRNVPAEFHRRLKIRAATEGMSMSDYVVREVGKALDHPTRHEVLMRLAGRPARRPKRTAAEVVPERGRA